MVDKLTFLILGRLTLNFIKDKIPALSAEELNKGIKSRFVGIIPSVLKFLKGMYICFYQIYLHGDTKVPPVHDVQH